jgi:hypothetical protein
MHSRDGYQADNDKFTAWQRWSELKSPAEAPVAQAFRRDSICFVHAWPLQMQVDLGLLY